MANEIGAYVSYGKSSIQVLSQAATQSMNGPVIENVNAVLEPYMHSTPFDFVEYILENGWNTMNNGGKIEDTGIGMSEEFLPHIFDEFVRERDSTTSGIAGTGLGMGITKKLIDLMHGTIRIDSKLGKGTKVTITLPHRIASVPQQPAEKGQIDKELFQGKRILLAEDNELNAEIAMEILQDYGFVVERASDGIICVDMLEKAEPGYYSLILMDIQMPNMNGYQAAKFIRSMPEEAKKNIPIYAMTANAFEEDRQQALAMGMNGHIGKPVEMDKLLGVLMEALAAED